MSEATSVNHAAPSDEEMRVWLTLRYGEKFAGRLVAAANEPTGFGQAVRRSVIREMSRG